MSKPFQYYTDRAIELRATQRDGMMDAINQIALKPLAPEDVAVFRLELCNNQIDSHNSMFPDDELPVIAMKVIGKPLMELHDLRGSLPRGTFFASEVVSDGAKKTVVCDVYIPRIEENREAIANIEAGVYREISIGFSFRTPECSVCGKDLRMCEHVPGREYENASGKRMCYYTMRGILDVLEGSIVPSGAQGTKILQQIRSGAPDVLSSERAALTEGRIAEFCMKTNEILAELGNLRAAINNLRKQTETETAAENDAKSAKAGDAQAEFERAKIRIHTRERALKNA
jgi:hypothetical protein